ncbi:hypothetical protein MRB53_016362 [Persea americana]|uniref:Uncharacterized protein n=1 Tax=Persea americana TaxID=3435 RepID=A0ACC2M1Y4_PERAE|nr:hypothetical protein MRB53_016362 [Persea americana]
MQPFPNSQLPCSVVCSQTASCPARTPLHRPELLDLSSCPTHQRPLLSHSQPPTSCHLHFSGQLPRTSTSLPAAPSKRQHSLLISGQISLIPAARFPLVTGRQLSSPAITLPFFPPFLEV